MWRFGLGKRLQDIVGRSALLEGRALLHRYSASTDNRRPRFGCFPKSAPEISQIVEVARASKVPIAVAPAASSTPASYPRNSILIDLARMNKILEIDSANLCGVVQPLASIAALSSELEPLGLVVCSANRGGATAVDIAVTATGMEVVLPNGRIANVGGRPRDALACSLPSLFAAPDISFGIPTKIFLRLAQKNRAGAETPDAARAASPAETELLAHLSDILDPSKTFVRSSKPSAGKSV